MKKLAAWAFLVIYLNAAAQTLLPWVSDSVAHVLFWESHLEHVHHGQVHSHHVGLEMAANEEDAATHHTIPFFFDKDALSAHLVPDLPLVWGVTPRPLVALHVDWLFHYQSVVGDVFCPPPDALRVSRPA